MPHFTVVVCTGCSATRFFTKHTKDHFLTACHHEIIDVAAPSPYR